MSFVPLDLEEVLDTVLPQAVFPHWNYDFKKRLCLPRDGNGDRHKRSIPPYGTCTLLWQPPVKGQEMSRSPPLRKTSSTKPLSG